MSQLEDALGDDLRRMVIERSHDLITMIDPDGTIVYASPSWTSMLGWDPREVVGTSLADYCHPDDLAVGPADAVDDLDVAERERRCRGLEDLSDAHVSRTC